ncbi:MAG TPA: MBL fold metallo-hydrolase [Kofleriaceae bacterium]|nr:MBL fold metallo-hydrolase [Kofleriaceae bacterium]
MPTEETNARGQVTWIGHASAVVHLAKTRVLIDPLGRRRCRAAEPYDAILITHAHVDHLNRWTLSRLDKSARLIVPRGAARYVADLGFREVTEIEAGDQLAVGHCDVIAVPTRHDPGRWRKGDGATCAGYVIAHDGTAIHHSGDVDMSDFAVFEDIGQKFSLDATLLPIGGMLPVWFYRWRKNRLDSGVHIDPDTALAIAERLGAKAMVPVHWGTVHLRLGPPSAPRRRLAKIAAATGISNLVHILGHGDTLAIG